jgi:hypothetical protein
MVHVQRKESKRGQERQAGWYSEGHRVESGATNTGSMAHAKFLFFPSLKRLGSHCLSQKSTGLQIHPQILNFICFFNTQEKLLLVWEEKEKWFFQTILFRSTEKLDL